MNKPDHSSAPRLTGRRRLLTALAAGGGVVVARKGLPEHWGNPVVDAVSLPAHAAATGDGFTGSQTLSVGMDLMPLRAGGVTGLAKYFEAPAAQATPQGLAARLGNLVVPSAQAGPGVSTATVDGFALVSGNLVTLLQLRLTIRIQVASGGVIEVAEQKKECEVPVDETIQILLQRTNLPEGGAPVTINAVNCPNGGPQARISSISPTAVVVEVGFNGSPDVLVLTPGGSPFPVPTDCKSQKAALKDAVEESCFPKGM